MIFNDSVMRGHSVEVISNMMDNKDSAITDEE